MKLRNLDDMKSILKRFVAAAAVMLAIGWTLASSSQSITGTLIGTVTDPQGAVVTGGTVKATNVDTGVSKSVTTNDHGEYRIEFLGLGNYTLEVRTQSFKAFVQQKITLLADQTQRVDAQLQIGGVDEVVTVDTAPPQVETSTAELGRTISSDEINGLPLVNRNAYAELSLTAGVQSNSASRPSNPSGTPNFVFGVPSTHVIDNGGIDGGVPMVSYYLDGGINMTGLRNYGNPLPNPDALQGGAC